MEKICQKCNRIIPSDVDNCPYCGYDVLDIEVSKDPQIVNIKCPSCGSYQLDRIDDDDYKCKSCNSFFKVYTPQISKNVYVKKEVIINNPSPTSNNSDYHYSDEVTNEMSQANRRKIEPEPRPSNSSYDYEDYLIHENRFLNFLIEPRENMVARTIVFLIATLLLFAAFMCGNYSDKLLATKKIISITASIYVLHLYYVIFYVIIQNQYSEETQKILVIIDYILSLFILALGIFITIKIK